jgi:hypothetical protein
MLLSADASSFLLDTAALPRQAGGPNYMFKYIVDGNWVTDPAQPTASDDSGHTNHTIELH